MAAEHSWIVQGSEMDAMLNFQVLSRRTGVHIVAVTGFVAGDSALPYFREKSV